MKTLLATTIVVLMAGAGVANADISAEWVVNPGCTIRGYTTYDLEITTDAEWTNARLELTLTSGTIHQDPSYDEEHPQTTMWGFVPAVECDSMFSAPGYEVPGFASETGDGWTSTSVKRSWFDDVDTGSGTFVAARMTLSDGAEGPYSILLFDDANPGVATEMSGSITQDGDFRRSDSHGFPTEDPADPPAEDNTGDSHDPPPDYLNPLTGSYNMGPPPPLPEPGTMVLVSLGFLGMLIRRGPRTDQSQG